MQVPELGSDSKTRKYREEKRHTNSKVGEPDKLSYLQVLVGFEGPDGGVSELDVVQSLIRGVFVDFSTGEPIPMLLSQRCHFYNWELLLATFCLKRHRGDDRLWAELTHTYRSTHARTYTRVLSLSRSSSRRTPRSLFICSLIRSRFGVWSKLISSTGVLVNACRDCLQC